MKSCSRKIHFSYGHRVMDHENKCATLHGHNGIAWVYATPIGELDSLGRVVDFSVIKEKVGGWIDRFWDHTMILNKNDLKTIELLKQAPGKKTFFLLDGNPTAENMAAYLLHEVCPDVLNGLGVVVYKIMLYETENSVAEVSLDPNSDDIIKKYK